MKKVSVVKNTSLWACGFDVAKYDKMQREDAFLYLATCLGKTCKVRLVRGRLYIDSIPFHEQMDNTLDDYLRSQLDMSRSDTPIPYVYLLHTNEHTIEVNTQVNFITIKCSYQNTLMGGF